MILVIDHSLALLANIVMEQITLDKFAQPKYRGQLEIMVTHLKGLLDKIRVESSVIIFTIVIINML